MSEKRITFFGYTDYSVASFELIVKDLDEQYLLSAQESTKKLQSLRIDVDKNFKRLNYSQEIVEYIDYNVALFESLEYDFVRLVNELPKKVEDRHIEIIKTIVERNNSVERESNKDFKREHIVGKLKDESLRPLVDNIYQTVGHFLSRIGSLSAMYKRLQTYVGTEKQVDKIPGLDAKDRSVAPLSIPPGTGWGDVIIRFISEEAVSISVAGKSLGVKNFAELGFENITAKRPDRLWNMLKIISKEQEIPLIHHGKQDVKKTISELRGKLKELFRIDEDPFHPFKSTDSYRPKFLISVRKDY